MRFVEIIFPFAEKPQVISYVFRHFIYPRKSKKDLISHTITVIPRIPPDPELPQTLHTTSPIEPDTNPLTEPLTMEPETSPIQPNTNSMTSFQPITTSISSSVPPNTHHMQTRRNSGIVKPKQHLSLCNYQTSFA